MIIYFTLIIFHLADNGTGLLQISFDVKSIGLLVCLTYMMKINSVSRGSVAEELLVVFRMKEKR